VFRFPRLRTAACKQTPFVHHDGIEVVFSKMRNKFSNLCNYGLLVDNSRF